VTVDPETSAKWWAVTSVPPARKCFAHALIGTAAKYQRLDGVQLGLAMNSRMRRMLSMAD
jgi:hypothetical protein